ncbi:NAD(P)-dependent oxidoreductase [uncultured Schumannella sp.]|uniref:NAD-dependent epimerase/dehydratase family protein n=1 Tax=uncultured Schumannella sp. TaxID=1195956 RepID=UPI0025DB58B7|nr:NAD(P)-dependent oxidoreductase [uncultured Schumannella sp.]
MPDLTRLDPFTLGQVLVTGASGSIGREVVRQLAAAGVEVTGFDRHAVPPGASTEADTFVVGDSRNERDIACALVGCAAVIHCAALPSPAAGTPHEVFTTNVVSTFTVLSAAGQAGIRHASIASSINAIGVTFNSHDVMPAYFPLDEQLSSQLDDWYSLSKRQDELTAEMCASHWDMAIACLRLPHTGPESLIAEISALNLADPRRAVKEGWSYLHVADAARALILGLSLPTPGAEILFVAAPETSVPWPTAEGLARWAPGVPVRHPLVGRAVGIDTSRARELLGFEPEYVFPIAPRDLDAIDF